MIEVPVKLEWALLHLVHAGGGEATWHRLATRLPLCEAPLVPDMMVALTELLARGLVARGAGEGKDRWAITGAGEARLALLDPMYAPREAAPIADVPGPLTREELAAFATAIAGGLMATIEALRPHLDDAERLLAVLLQLLAASPGDAMRTAEVALFQREPERGRFARAMLASPDPAVREALFRAWTPVRTDVPGDPLPTVPDAELEALLRRGLRDEGTRVREAAAALAFLALRGAALVDELIDALAPGARNLQWWALLALGAARDPRSCALLVQVADGADAGLAGAAIRALGHRPDGRARWLAGLADARADVAGSARFALATVVTGLDERTVARLAADPRAEVRDAVALYRGRVTRN